MKTLLDHCKRVTRCYCCCENYQPGDPPYILNKTMTKWFCLDCYKCTKCGDQMTIHHHWSDNYINCPTAHHCWWCSGCPGLGNEYCGNAKVGEDPKDRDYWNSKICHSCTRDIEDAIGTIESIIFA